ncbi:MAG: hypothetical protein ACJA06_000471 [Halocynthiibacter sp.]|jgi:hypothetical protein
MGAKGGVFCSALLLFEYTTKTAFKKARGKARLGINRSIRRV